MEAFKLKLTIEDRSLLKDYKQSCMGDPKWNGQLVRLIIGGHKMPQRNGEGPSVTCIDVTKSRYKRDAVLNVSVGYVDKLLQQYCDWDDKSHEGLCRNERPNNYLINRWGYLEVIVHLLLSDYKFKEALIVDVVVKAIKANHQSLQ